MKIIVTGGAGFIGSYLVNELVKSHEVVILDNLSTGKKSNINPKAKFIKGDIREEKDVKKAISGCDAVFHLAAQTDVRKSQEDPDYDHQVNVTGAKNVFLISKELGAKIIFTSSAAVYGNSLLTKEDTKLKPISEYGKNKLEAEKFLDRKDFIVRIFNCYGPNGRGFINKLCENVKQGKKMTIFGGRQTRDFIYVTDVVNALILGLESDGIYNVGSGVETSILGLIDIVSKISSKKPTTRLSSAREGEIEKSRADISKIKSLGWKPKVSLKEGVRRVWNSV